MELHVSASSWQRVSRLQHISNHATGDMKKKTNMISDQQLIVFLFTETKQLKQQNTEVYQSLKVFDLQGRSAELHVE